MTGVMSVAISSPAAARTYRCGGTTTASSSSPSLSLAHPRGRRCVRILAFRPNDSSDTTTATNGKTKDRSRQPAPPGIVYKINDRGYVDVKSAEEEEALEKMQREERIRDVQRAATDAVDKAKSWWAGVPDKRSLVVGGAAAAVAAYLGSAVLDAVDRVPLLPGLLQAVGLGYSSWFWWRFVLFAEGRAELRSSLGALRRRVNEQVDELTERTLDSHPNPGTGETGLAATARKVVRQAAERNSHQQTSSATAAAWEQRAGIDDGSWVDEPAVPSAGSEGAGGALDDSYVEGLMQELDERSRSQGPGDTPGSGGSGGAAGGRNPMIFAFVVSGGVDGGTRAEAGQPGEESGGGTSTSSSSSSSASSSSAADVDAVGQGDLDPCLGWDTEACAASGHLQLGEPDKGKLDELADKALRQAREAVGFSRHVDQVLHEAGGHNPGSLESVHLEGEHGRAAGTMERELMEDMAARNDRPVAPPGSTRKPATGEDAGVGPHL